MHVAWCGRMRADAFPTIQATLMLLSRLPIEISDTGTVPTRPTTGRDVPSGRLSVHRWLTAVLLLEAAGTAAGVYTMQLVAVPGVPHAVHPWAGTAAAVAVWLLAAHSQQLYDEAMMLSGRPVLPRIAWAVITTFGIVLLVTVGCQTNGALPARQTGCALCAAACILAVRIVWSECLKAAIQDGRHVEHALVVAETPLAARWAAARIERATSGRVSATASTAVSTIGPHQAMGLAYGVCSVDAIEAEVRANRFDRVLIMASGKNGALLCESTATLVTRLARLAIDVTVLPDGPPLALGPRSARRLGDLSGIDLVSRPFPLMQRLLKRIEDIVLAGLILLAVAPAMLVIATLIKMESPGPVLFSQRRIGFHDQVFRVWKFRTMYVDLTDEAGAAQTTRHDPRVTRLGRLLRRTSLDEMPQFFNVVLGDMSIVGPRPHAVGMTVAGQPMHELVEAYSARHRIKPGITGWAQVNGCRGEINSEQKLSRRLTLDCHYIANWSLALDVYVIARTAAMLAFDQHAY